MNLGRFWAVFVCRNREFLRDRSSLAWSLVFPVFIIAGFAFAFSGPALDLYKVGVLGDAARNHDNAFLQTRHIQFISVTDPAAALTKVERHQLDMLFDPVNRRYWINDESSKGYALERMLRGADAASVYGKQTVTGRAIRYVDWVLPGVLAMNMMFGCLFGVGYVIVRYRKSGMLKRLKATPLTPLEFLAAQIASRLWLMLATTVLVYAGTDLFVGFAMFGSYFSLLLVLTVGAISLISLGMVWFSLEGVHPWLRMFAQILPLTHIVDAGRAIMIDGAGLAAISGHLLALTAMTLGFMVIGAWMFRWE